MSYEVTLLVFGVLLLLLGIVGKVKAKELEVGTSSTIARAITAIVGAVLVLVSFNPDIAKTYLTSISGSETQSEASSSQEDQTGTPEPSLTTQKLQRLDDIERERAERRARELNTLHHLIFEHRKKVAQLSNPAQYKISCE